MCRVVSQPAAWVGRNLESLPALLGMLAVPTCTFPSGRTDGGEEVGDLSDAVVMCVVFLTHEALRDYVDDDGRGVVAVGGDTVGSRKSEDGGNGEREICK